MKLRVFSPLVTFLLLSGASGCGGAPKTDVAEDVGAMDLPTVPGRYVYHEYKKIHSVEAGSGSAKSLVGYLDHRTSEEDTDGKYFVLNMAHDVRGFILPSGRAYIFEGSDPSSMRSRDLGQTSLENGVKKILGVAGGIEFEVIKSGTTTPAETSDRS